MYAAVLPSIAARLIGACVRRVHYRILDPRFERRHGIETAGLHWPHELTISSENAAHSTESAPTPARVFLRALKALDGIDFQRFAFVDIGSGKGRMLLLASERPFARIDGVEFAQELYEISLRNIRSFAARGHRCDHIRVHHLDAAQYRIPEQPCVLYLFHPFGASVLSRVLDNIEASFRENPRDIYLVFLNLKLRELLESRSFLHEVPRRPLTRLADLLQSPHPITVYRAADACGQS